MNYKWWFVEALVLWVVTITQRSGWGGKIRLRVAHPLSASVSLTSTTESL